MPTALPPNFTHKLLYAFRNSHMPGACLVRLIFLILITLTAPYIKAEIYDIFSIQFK